MGQCPTCEKESGIDKRGRKRKFCSRLCLVRHNANCRRLKEKTCEGCKKIYLPKFSSKQKFCTMSCKAKTYWKNGRCKVDPETSLKNLIRIPNQGKSKIYPNNRYKRIGKKGKYEHRMIMEEKLGRRLNKNEHVHHINGNPRDNRLENLEVLTNSEHLKIHMREHIKFREINK